MYAVGTFTEIKQGNYAGCDSLYSAATPRVAASPATPGSASCPTHKDPEEPPIPAQEEPHPSPLSRTASVCGCPG